MDGSVEFYQVTGSTIFHNLTADLRQPMAHHDHIDQKEEEEKKENHNNSLRNVRLHLSVIASVLHCTGTKKLCEERTKGKRGKD